MGTNYYARIIPKEDEKNELINKIVNNQFDKIVNLASELYGHRNEYTRKGNVIHLGKRSGGWKFLWNPNVIRYSDGYLDENKQYVHVYKYDYVYPLTKQGITDFCNREDVIITDEYGEQFDSKECLEMAFSWEEPDGYTGKTYEEAQKDHSYYKSHYHYWSEKHQREMHTKDDEMWFDLGYIVEYYDFESDGLRFATSINFC
jgi:hypothetical protein